MLFRDRISRLVHHTSVRIGSSIVIRRVQGSKTLIKNVGLVLKNSADLVSRHSHVPQYLLILIREERMPNSVKSRRELKMVLLEQEGFQTRFLKYPPYSVRRSAIQNRGYAFYWTRNHQGLGGNVGRSRAGRCVRIVKFSRVRQGFYFVL